MNSKSTPAPHFLPGLPPTLEVLQAITTATKDGLFVKGRDGLYLYCNETGAKYVGYSIDEIVGHDDIELFGIESGSPVREQDQRVLASGEPESGEQIVLQGGERRVINVQISPLRDAQGETVGVLGVMRDITQKRSAENAVRMQKDVLEQIAVGMPLETVLEKITEFVQLESPDTICSFMLCNDTSSTLHYTAGRITHPKLRKAVESLPVGPTIGACGTAAYRGEPVFIADMETDPLAEVVRDLAREVGFRASWSFPIFAHSPGKRRVLGTFAVYSPDPGLPRKELIRAVDNINYLASVAIESNLGRAKLEASEKRFRTFVENSADSFFMFDEKGQILDISENACARLGYEPSELLGKTALVFDPTGTPDVIERIGRDLDDGKTVRFETIHFTKSGDKYPVEVRISPFARGGSFFSIANCSDMTDRHRAQQLLQQSEELYRAIFEFASVGISQSDPQTGKLLEVNTRYCEITGYSREELLGMTFLDITHPEDRDHNRDLYEKSARGEAKYVVEKRYVRKDGKIVWVRVNASFFARHGTESLKTIAVMEDITEQKLAENELRESERRFRNLADAIPQIVWTATPEGDLNHLNARTSQYTGLPESELTGWKWGQVIHPDDLPRTLESWQSQIASEVPQDIEFRIRRHDGQYRWHIARQVINRSSTGQALVWYGTCTDIHDRKMTEQALLESESRFRRLFETIDDTILVMDETGRIQSANPAAARMHGYSMSELIGMSIRELDCPDGSALVADRLRRLKSGQSLSFEINHRRKDGSIFPVEVVASPMQVGDEFFVLAIDRDITQRKNAEKSLRLAQFSIESAVDCFLWVGPTSQILYANEMASRMLGYDRAELQKLSIGDIDPRFTMQAWEQHWEHLKGLKAFKFENQLQRKDGILIDTEVSVNYLVHEGVEYNCAVIRDITSRKRTERRLATQHALVSILASAENLQHAAPQLLRAFCETNGWDAGDIWIIDQSKEHLECVDCWHAPHAGLEHFCEEAKRIRFRKGHGLPGRIWESKQSEWITDLASDDRFIQKSAALTSGIRCAFGFPIEIGHQILGVATFFSFEPRQPDSEWVQTIKSIGSQIGQFIERKQAEEGIRLFRALIDRISDIVEVIDPTTGRFVDINQCGYEAHGYTREEYLRLSVPDVDPSIPRSDFPLPVQALREIGGRRVFESLHKRKDGTLFPVEVCTNVISLGKDYLVAIVRDITLRKQLEEQYLQSQKMEAVGRLAGGIAHDFNNILTVISCRSEILLASYSENNNDREHILAIRDAGERAATLTSQLLAFSRKSILEPKVLDLNRLLENDAKMLLRLIGEDILLRVESKANPSSILADSGQIERVLMNLAVNARDAMPKGGHLIMTTENIEIRSIPGPHSPGKPSSPKPGRYVLLSVSDTGEGMSEEVASRIFEPFFTTKKVGKGTGLGLAVVHGVMQQCDGFVDVESEIGKGTRFLLYFPEVQPIAKQASDTSVPTEGRGVETVLLVEDEEQVRRISKIALESQGYRVLEASGGLAALRLLSNADEPVHILVTDVVMPEMGGVQLVEAARLLIPNLRVLYVSGYTGDRVNTQGINETSDPLLQKPFTPQSLARKVREVLDGAGKKT